MCFGDLSQGKERSMAHQKDAATIPCVVIIYHSRPTVKSVLFSHKLFKQIFNNFLKREFSDIKM